MAGRRLRSVRARSRLRRAARRLARRSLPPPSVDAGRAAAGLRHRRAESGIVRSADLRRLPKASTPAARASVAPAKKSAARLDETIRLLSEGRTFEEIARIRDRQLGTVVGLVADLVEKGRLKFDPGWVDEKKRITIEDICARLGLQWLKPVKDGAPAEITFEEIRLVVVKLAKREDLMKLSSDISIPLASLPTRLLSHRSNLRELDRSIRVDRAMDA